MATGALFCGETQVYYILFGCYVRVSVVDEHNLCWRFHQAGNGTSLGYYNFARSRWRA